MTKFLIEFVAFMAILTLAIVLGGTVLWIGGSPFHLRFGSSVFLSLIVIAFVLPAALNVWIMLRGSRGETIAQRAMAGIRGFGMLLIAVAGFAFLIVDGAAGRSLGIISGIGIALYFVRHYCRVLSWL